MILRLRYAVSYSCAGASSVMHRLRLRPRVLTSQRMVAFAMAADPAPSRQQDSVDHFGNSVTLLVHDGPLSRCALAAEASVELLFRPTPAATPPWEEVVDAVRTAGGAWREAEFAFPSPLTPPLPEARLLAEGSFLPGRPIAQAAASLAGRVGEQFRCVPDAPLTPLADVLESRAGGQRDLVHLLITGLRSFGLPARFVIGYGPGDSGAARLRTWAACWLGRGLGWLDLDLQAGSGAGARPVCVAWGRDYEDVAPVRSVLLGGEKPEITTEIETEAIPAADG